MITDVQIMMFFVCIANIIFLNYIWWNRKEKFHINVSTLITIAFLLGVIIENWDAKIVRTKMDLCDIALLSALLLVDFCIYIINKDKH